MWITEKINIYFVPLFPYAEIYSSAKLKISYILFSFKVYRKKATRTPR